MPVYDETYWREQEEYNRQCELEWDRQQAEYYFEVYIQEQREMKKYPLFFWRELCERKQRETCKPLKGKKK